MLEQARAHVRNQRRRQPRVPALVPDRDDRGEDAGGRQHPEDLVQRLEILLAERVVDQKFQAERHDDIEQRLDHHAETDERQDFLVIAEVRLDEAIDGRERAGRFLRGKDDEVLIVLVILAFGRVVFLVVVVIGWLRRRGRPAGDDAHRGAGLHEQLVFALRRGGAARGSGLFFIRCEWLGRHVTNRYCTAGMTAGFSYAILERDGIESPLRSRFLIEHDFSENRYPLFRIMP